LMLSKVAQRWECDRMLSKVTHCWECEYIDTQ